MIRFLYAKGSSPTRFQNISDYRCHKQKKVVQTVWSGLSLAQRIAILNLPWRTKNRSQGRFEMAIAPHSD